tara:strand:- start:372 stop:599 length:228 start_codon:yes stop_codon:yes gene_type:complete
MYTQKQKQRFLDKLEQLREQLETVENDIMFRDFMGVDGCNKFYDFSNDIEYDIEAVSDDLNDYNRAISLEYRKNK